MKTILIALVAVALPGFAQEVPAGRIDNGGNLQLTSDEYRQLSDRFVSTIKETQVDSQLLSVPQIKEITDQFAIKADDLKLPDADPNSPAKKREAAKAEFKKKFENISDADIKELEKKLKLDGYGLVQGKDRASLVNFFTSRIEKALYGLGAQGEELRLKDSKLVDHKVFNDLYTSQLGKTILLELSNYCYNVVSPTETNGTAVAPGSDKAFQNWERLLSSECKVNPGDAKAMAQCVKNLRDNEAPPQSTYTGSNKPDPYKELSQRLGVVSNAQQFFGNYFNICSRVIPYLCEIQTYCKLPDQAAKDAWAQNNEFLKNYIATKPTLCDKGAFPGQPELGENSCFVQNRLKAYRTNLKIATDTDKKLREEFGDTNKLGNFAGTQKIYDASSRDENSIEAITSLTSQDTAELLKKSSKEGLDDFDKKQCESRPEAKECEAYFYNDQEAERFQNSSLKYVAATELEKKKIDMLKDKDTELKKYLTDRGYVDLIDKIGKGDLDNTKIVEIAKARFEAERDSAFEKMEDAFKKKQISKDDTQIEKTQTGADSKLLIQDKGNKLTQLLIFNNVITSYLTIDKGGKEYSNSRVLQRETDKISQAGGEVDADAAKFFINLGKSSQSSGGGRGAAGSASDEIGGSASLVDVNFLDQILADKKSDKPDSRSTSPR